MSHCQAKSSRGLRANTILSTAIMQDCLFKSKWTAAEYVSFGVAIQNQLAQIDMGNLFCYVLILRWCSYASVYCTALLTDGGKCWIDIDFFLKKYAADGGFFSCAKIKRQNMSVPYMLIMDTENTLCILQVLRTTECDVFMLCGFLWNNASHNLKKCKGEETVFMSPVSDPKVHNHFGVV